MLSWDFCFLVWQGFDYQQFVLENCLGAFAFRCDRGLIISSLSLKTVLGRLLLGVTGV